VSYPSRDKDNLPTSINLGMAVELPVRQHKPMDGLGCLDTRDGHEAILINTEQPKVGKHIILLHELIHLALEHLKDEKVIRRQPSELVVTNLAGSLFSLLAANGLWNGVTLEELEEFIKTRK